MIVRRFVALLTTLAMLHLSATAGDFACAQHGGQRDQRISVTVAAIVHQVSGSDDEMVMTGARHVHGARSLALATGESRTPPCESPVLPRCCGGFANCSVTSAVAKRDQIPAIPAVASRVQVALVDAPPSFRPAPEPPPPKA
ncbi:MAG: hypothetical protein NVS4B3_00240 [Gemmatimonadaceae bacterium]